MGDACHWVRGDDGVEVMIPMCWASILDPSACTCEVEPSRLERAEMARSVAEGEVLRLREKLRRNADQRAIDRIKFDRLWQENRSLRTAQREE